ncbi:MAG TPA: AAA-associated domain-containing protein [Sulfolobales archaeon]|nr:AAA-associated domain-containing protein [Sulfolobales archaeon]
MSQHRKVNLPICVTIDQVVGLVEALYSLGGSADTSKISEVIDADAGLLPNVIDVAESMGLVRLEKGDLVITDTGKEVAKADSRSMKKILRNLAMGIEPISSIIKMLNEKGSIHIEELRSMLEEFYGSKASEAIECLIHWGTYLNIFRWRPEEQEIVPIRRAPRREI